MQSVCANKTSLKRKSMTQRKKYIEEKTNELDKRFKNLNVKDRKERLKLMEDLVLLEKEE